ncbi:MAG: hypothetical protein MZW92_54925 [Comamonadaceae bacterium]|nr:hypothetical protein [Comamonadaceae bacterium]
MSLDPPLVLWSLRRASPSLAAFDSAEPLRRERAGRGRRSTSSRRFAAPAGRQVRRGRVAARAWAARRCWPAARRCSSARRVSRLDGGDHRAVHRPRAAAGRICRCRRCVFHGGHYRLLGEVL